MRFLIDAQLPQLLAIRLTELGHTARHTLNLPDKNFSTDSFIASIGDAEGETVVTKDADFLNSHLLKGSPASLLLVSTGNIANRQLLSLFETHIEQIVEALGEAQFIEITPGGLLIHH